MTDDTAPFYGGPGPDAAALARAAGLLQAMAGDDTQTYQRILMADAEEGGSPYQTLTAVLSFAYTLTTAVADLSGDTRETVMANVTAALVNLTTDTDNEGEDR